MDVVERPLTVVALLLAGGVGERAAQGGAKQLAVLGGMTVLERAVGVFEEHPRVGRVVVAMPPDLVKQAAMLVPTATVVSGGDTRQQSAVNGLDVIDEDALVLIHDVARPFISADVIDRCIDALQTFDAVGTVISSSDTVYRVREGDIAEELVEVPKRTTVRRAQTPQGFRCGIIRDAHRKAAEAGSDVTDDCSAVLRHRPDVPIALVAGDERNLKLTTPADFAWAREHLAT